MEGLKWYDHIELTGAFLILIYVLGTLIRLFFERWIQKPPCEKCVALIRIPAIELKQAEHREEDHVQLTRDLTEIKGSVNLVLEKVNHIKEMIDKNK